MLMKLLCFPGKVLFFFFLLFLQPNKLEENKLEREKKEEKQDG